MQVLATGPDAVSAILSFLQSFSSYHEELRTIAFIIFGIAAACFAGWRCKIADRNIANDRYHRAAKLLHSDYSGRVAGAASLTQLARTYPADYHVIVMKVFTAVLSFAPAYGGGKGPLDPDSEETVIILDAIKNITARQRAAEKKAHYVLALHPISKVKIDPTTRTVQFPY